LSSLTVDYRKNLVKFTYCLNIIQKPTFSANTTYEGETKIKAGYRKIRTEVDEWVECLSNRKASCDKEENSIVQLKKFVRESLEYHPCTHAEISAILDAAKLGISVKGTTLYTTTFPLLFLVIFAPKILLLLVFHEWFIYRLIKKAKTKSYIQN
jgi:hypothetical protein